MTRARDLADSADKDIAGTLTLDAVNASGVITGLTVEATGDTAAGDNAAMGYTAAEGLVLTGQGSTNDVTIKNDADADVIEIPTGTVNVTMAGTLAVTGDVTLSNDLKLAHDGAVLGFGADNEITLTHVHNEGLIFNGSSTLNFRNSDSKIHSSADNQLDLIAATEVEITAPTIQLDASTKVDLNGNLDVSGTALVTGVLTTTAATVFNGGFASNANSTVGGTLITTGNLSISETGANNEKSLTMANSSATGMIGVEGSSANRFSGSAANNMFIGTTSADGLEFATNNTVRANIASDGTTSFNAPITAAGGSGSNNDTANILTLNASQHARLLVDTSSTSAHRASLVLESNGQETVLSTTGSVSDLTAPVGDFAINTAANSFVVSAVKGLLAESTNTNFINGSFDLSLVRGRTFTRAGQMSDDHQMRVFVGSYTYHGGSIEYQIREDGGTQNVIGGGVIYYSAREAEPNATIVGTNIGTKIVVTGDASGATTVDNKFTFMLRATNGDSHISISNRVGSLVNMTLRFNILYQG